MLLKVEVEIAKSKEDVWRLISDIEHAATFISGIEEIKVLENPASGITGFKWEETRTIFGKTAKETMWITDSVENESYETRAESHGMLYETKLSVEQIGDQSLLSMTFTGTPQTLGTKLVSWFMDLLFGGTTKKLLQQDLADIKSFLEK